MFMMHNADLLFKSFALQGKPADFLCTIKSLTVSALAQSLSSRKREFIRLQNLTTQKTSLPVMPMKKIQEMSHQTMQTWCSTTLFKSFMALT